MGNSDLKPDESNSGFIDLLKGIAGEDLLSALINPSIEFKLMPSKKMVVPTFRGKILTRAEWNTLIKRVQEFYNFFNSDHIKLINDKARQIEPDEWFKIDFSEVQKKGYLIVLQSPDNRYRIGVCSNLQKRLNEVKASGFYKIVHNYKTPNMRFEENYWRVRLKNYLIENTEWYNLPENELNVLLQTEETMVDELKNELDTPKNLERKKRTKKYWAILTETLGSIPSARTRYEATAIQGLIKTVDKNEGWTDQDVFDCLVYIKKDKKFNGLISYTTVANYLSSYMARIKNNDGKEEYADDGNDEGFSGKNSGNKHI